MALAATTIHDVRTTGSDNNGGSFDPGNSGFSTNGAATSANTSAPVFTSASYDFVAGDVGHWLYVKSGTNWTPGWYQIASVAGNAATLTAGVGTAGQGAAGLAADAINTVAGCATVASPTGATWGLDYSQTDTARIAFTDMVIDATTNTKFTSAANPVGVNFVGNTVRVTGGTGFTVQRAQISSVVGTVATCEKSLGTLSSTGGTGNLGGAMASPGSASSAIQNLNTIFIKYNATAYNCSATPDVSGGRINNGNGLILVGWDTTRTIGNSDANRPTLNANAASMTLYNSTNASQAHNLSFDNSGSNASVTLMNSSAFTLTVRRCKFRRSTTSGLTVSGPITRLSDLEFDTNSGTQALLITGSTTACGISVYGCTATNAITMIPSSSTGSLNDCLVANYAGTGNCYNLSSAVTATNCTGHASGATAGHIFTVTSRCELRNCLAVGGGSGGGGGRGFNANAAQAESRLVNCAAWDNDSGTHNYRAGQVEGFVTLSADPFVAAGTDFRLNSTAGGGAACRGVGAPATYPGYGAANAPDIGAYQTAGGGGSGGGGGGYIPFGGAFSHIREH